MQREPHPSTYINLPPLVLKVSGSYPEYKIGQIEYPPASLYVKEKVQIHWIHLLIEFSKSALI